MIYRRSDNFRKAFGLFKANPYHPSLGVKKIKGRDNIWEGRIDIFYQFTFQYLKEEGSPDTICLFRNIGPHNIIEEAP